MKIIRGAFAGRTARLRQLANDWMSVDIDGRGQIVKPTEVQLTETEAQRVTEHQHVGSFWSQWELLADGTFRARKGGR